MNTKIENFEIREVLHRNDVVGEITTGLESLAEWVELYGSVDQGCEFMTISQAISDAESSLYALEEEEEPYRCEANIAEAKQLVASLEQDRDNGVTHVLKNDNHRLDYDVFYEESEDICLTDDICASKRYTYELGEVIEETI